MGLNLFGTSNENKLEPYSPVSGGESSKGKMEFPANERDVQFSNPFFIELIGRIKNNLGSIKHYTQISLGKFYDREFGEYYYRSLTEDIERMEIVLNGLMDYMKLHTPTRKIHTVHSIIEEVLKNHRVKLEEKGIKVLKRFEKDLPETIIPDEQLRYVLSSVLEYVVIVTPAHSNITLWTRSFLLEKENGKTEDLFQRGGKYLEISVIFSVHHREGVPVPGTGTIHKEEVPDILLRFVKDVVRQNHGIMKMGTNEKRTKTLISLRFPVERRKAVYYQSVN
jgi:hypothetical protein